MADEGKGILKIAAFFGFVIVAVHVVIVFIGAPAYRFFGASERIARLAETGSLFPPLITLFFTAVLIVFTLYTLSAAEMIARLPCLKIVLPGITLVYLLRPLPTLLPILHPGHGDLPHGAGAEGFALFFLLIGLCNLAGTIRSWKRL